MEQSDSQRLRALLDRLARLSAAEAWTDDLTPTQLAALDYLSQANRFSRAPSQVADYLCATRGTVSQTLKTLEKRRLISEERSAEDKRRISYSLTPSGERAVIGKNALDVAIDRLSASHQQEISTALDTLLTNLLATRGGRPFGLCHTCRHHVADAKGGRHCSLLNVALTPRDANQICHEHVSA